MPLWKLEPNALTIEKEKEVMLMFIYQPHFFESILNILLQVFRITCTSISLTFPPFPHTHLSFLFFCEHTIFKGYHLSTICKAHQVLDPAHQKGALLHGATKSTKTSLLLQMCFRCLPL